MLSRSPVHCALPVLSAVHSSDSLRLWDWYMFTILFSLGTPSIPHSITLAHSFTSPFVLIICTGGPDAHASSLSGIFKDQRVRVNKRAVHPNAPKPRSNLLGPVVCCLSLVSCCVGVPVFPALLGLFCYMVIVVNCWVE